MDSSSRRATTRRRSRSARCSSSTWPTTTRTPPSCRTAPICVVRACRSAATSSPTGSYRVEYEFVGTSGITDALRRLHDASSRSRSPPVSSSSRSAWKRSRPTKASRSWNAGLPFAFITTRAPGLMVSSSGNALDRCGRHLRRTGRQREHGAGGRRRLRRGRTRHVCAVRDRQPRRAFRARLRLSRADPGQQHERDRSQVRDGALSQQAGVERACSSASSIPANSSNVAQYTIGGAEFAMQWNALSWQSEYQWTDVDRNISDDLDVRRLLLADRVHADR